MNKLVRNGLIAGSVVVAGVVGFSLYMSHADTVRRKAAINSDCVSFYYNFDAYKGSLFNMRNNCGLPITLVYVFEKDQGKQCSTPDHACIVHLKNQTATQLRVEEYGKDNPYHPDGLKLLACRDDVNCYTSQDQLTRPKGLATLGNP